MVFQQTEDVSAWRVEYIKQNSFLLKKYIIAVMAAYSHSNEFEHGPCYAFFPEKIFQNIFSLNIKGVV